MLDVIISSRLVRHTGWIFIVLGRRRRAWVIILLLYRVEISYDILFWTEEIGFGSKSHSFPFFINSFCALANLPSFEIYIHSYILRPLSPRQLLRSLLLQLNFPTSFSSVCLKINLWFILTTRRRVSKSCHLVSQIYVQSDRWAKE